MSSPSRDSFPCYSACLPFFLFDFKGTLVCLHLFLLFKGLGRKCTERPQRQADVESGGCILSCLSRWPYVCVCILLFHTAVVRVCLHLFLVILLSQNSVLCVAFTSLLLLLLFFFFFKNLPIRAFSKIHDLPGLLLVQENSQTENVVFLQVILSRWP